MATRIETPYTQRARYSSSADGFNIKRPRIHAHVFVAERDRALDPATPTGLIPLDLSRALELEAIHRLPAEVELTGKAVAFSSASQAADRTCLPSMTLAMNSLAPGEMQRPHQHNAVAVTLIVQGARCYSMVEGRRVPWQDLTTMITPPCLMHSHHNDGDRMALFLIVQDGGLHYHTRTMGFSY